MSSDSGETWRSYDDFAAGIDTFRAPSVDLSGRSLRLTRLDGVGPQAVAVNVEDASRATWTTPPAPPRTGAYDAVAVRPEVLFLNLPDPAGDGRSDTVIVDESSGYAVGVVSAIAPTARPGIPRVTQEFTVYALDGVTPTGPMPGPSRDLIGRRNLYRYSPEHLYEHVYLSSERYSWQCLQGVQRGHGDTDLSTVWRVGEDLYLFCFREFRIAVASVWLHDLAAGRTVGVFLGIGEHGATHAKAGGHIIPLGAVTYPDIEPV